MLQISKADKVIGGGRNLLIVVLQFSVFIGSLMF